jgi:hypothetical protein
MAEVLPPPTRTSEPHDEGRERSDWRRELRQLVPSRKVGAAVLTIAVSAWFLPALSHQWQDRQKAHELKAALVTKIGRATTEAIVTSEFLASGRLPHTRRGGFNQNEFNVLDLDWQRDAAEIEAQLQAYFPGSGLVEKWREYSNFVRNTYFLVTDRVFQRDVTVTSIVELSPAEERKKIEKKLKPLRTPFVKTQDTGPRLVYYFASREVLSAKAAVANAILAAHPRGFSTRASDLARDLLP